MHILRWTVAQTLAERQNEFFQGSALASGSTLIATQLRLKAALVTSTPSVIPESREPSAVSPANSVGEGLSPYPWSPAFVNHGCIRRGFLTKAVNPSEDDKQ